MLNEKLMPADVIGWEYLQQLQESIAEAANVSTIILDSLGNPITKITNPRGICKLAGAGLRDSPVCQNTRKDLCGMARETRKPSFMVCPVSGMTGASVPIFLDDVFIGAWIIGQVRFLGEPLDSFARAAQKAGLDSDSALSIIEDIPVFSRSQFETIVDFMSIITEEIIKQEELYQLAFFDQLLHIPNAKRMENVMKTGRSYEALVAVTLADLKRINNIFGRACGDALLMAVRDYILESGIPDSALYKGQGCDFCILFESTGENNDLPRMIAEKIHERCKKVWEIHVGEQMQNIITSASICVLPLDKTHEHFFSYLSSALEHSLEIARKTDSVVIFDNGTREEFNTGLKLELSLKNAVREGMRGFFVVYQPIVDMGAAMWKGLEALCRWDSPEFGSVPPSVFIPIAEAIGLIGAVGLWVLEQSVMQIKEWGLDRIKGFILEVNLSPVQITIPNLDKNILELLNKYDYPPEKLGLEVTGSGELNFSGHTMKVIERLSELGVVIVLDDFGTGYSSCHALHKLPVKILKTERAFITGMESDSHLQKQLCVMIGLAHGSDMKLVAEGVESNLQVQFLLKQGADFFQGYFFSRPLTSLQLAEKLDNFYYPITYLTSGEYAGWELTRLDESLNESEEHGMNPGMFKLLNRCVKEIFRNNDSNDAIDALLSYIGEELRVSRAYVFIKESDGTYSNVKEWCASGIPSEKDSLRCVPIEQMYAQWTDTLKKDGLLVASDIRTLGKDIYDGLNRQGIKAVVGFPIWKDGELHGFVGFDDCEDIHNWMHYEVQILHTLTGLITSVLSKIWLQDEVAALDKMRESILNNINTVIYVSDLKTNEILFANTEMQRMYGNSLMGRVCWEALQNRNERCAFCPIPYLLKNPGKNYRWEFYNEISRRRFQIQDSIIPWTGGKLVHLEYAVDISDTVSGTKVGTQSAQPVAARQPPSRRDAFAAGKST